MATGLELIKGDKSSDTWEFEPETPCRMYYSLPRIIVAARNDKLIFSRHAEVEGQSDLADSLLSIPGVSKVELGRASDGRTYLCIFFFTLVLEALALKEVRKTLFDFSMWAAENPREANLAVYIAGGRYWATMAFGSIVDKNSVIGYDVRMQTFFAQSLEDDDGPALWLGIRFGEFPTLQSLKAAIHEVGAQIVEWELEPAD